MKDTAQLIFRAKLFKLGGPALPRLVRRLLTLLFAATPLFATFSAQAQSYPNKPIRLIVPFAPGGVTDVSGRIVATALAKRLNQQVIVENKPGASGNIGAQLVSKAAPDGYTLLLALDGTLVINPHVYERTGFDALNDFAPIAKVGDSIIIIVAHPSVGVKTLAEVIALSKSNGKGLEFGTSGSGSITHVAGELLKQQSGANLVHVPYKGGGPAAADVVAGHIPLAFASASSVAQFLEAGRLIPIGVPSPKRSVVFPNVATFAESGVQGVELNSWVGVLAPANTPDGIVKQLNVEINAVLAEPEVKTQLQGYGIIAASGSTADFAAEIKRDFDLYGPVTKQAGIKAN
ncbi:MAG: Bug family tripartite tricarboxylate transporter substrate binding protein [Zwartia sp.]